MMRRWIGVLTGSLLVCSLPVIAQNTGGGGGGGALSDGSTIGIMKGDGSTITCTAGVCVASSGGSAGITQLTGDVTAGPGSGSAAATLANTAVTAASYGSSTSIPSFTVDAKGRLTAAAGNAVVAPAGTLTGTTLASGVVTSSLTTVGTIGTGTWAGTTIAVNHGGTGITAFGTGVATALGLNVSGTGAICLASGSACSGGGSAITINSTTVTSGSANYLLYGDGSVVQNAALTAGTPNIVITAPTTVGTTTTFNAQTGTSYTWLTGDNTKLVTLSNGSAVAVTLPQAGSAGFASGWGNCAVNLNTGLVTITTTTSTINGSGQTAKLPQGGFFCPNSDGTNWAGPLSPLQIPGTSGGIPYYAATNELLSSGALTANLPVFGGGAGSAPIVGTRSGNTTEVATVTGSLTSGNCIKSDASGNLVDAATTCGGGGGGIGTKIATCTAASTTCNFNSLGSHDYYNLKCSGLTVGTASASIILQVNSDSTSGHYAWSYHYGKLNGTTTTGDSGQQSDTSILLGNGLATSDVFDFEMNLKDLASTTLEKMMTFQTMQGSGAGAGWQTEGGGAFTVTGTAVTSVQVTVTSGTFGSGANKCTMYAYDS